VDKNKIATSSRYWKKQVAFSSNVCINELTGCHEWQGSRHPQGYGLAKRVICEPVEPRAHRRAWIIANGPIPDGMLVLHDCDNPCCVNVDHLSLGTDADNSDDMYSRRRNVNLSGAEHARSKFSPEDVLRVKEAHKFGARPVDLCRIYGVSDAAVHNILSGKSWKHLG
jgi:hypothetical protein